MRKCTPEPFVNHTLISIILQRFGTIISALYLKSIANIIFIDNHKIQFIVSTGRKARLVTPNTLFPGAA